MVTNERIIQMSKNLNVRTYQITLPESYAYKSLQFDDIKMEITTKYADTFKGYCCGTQGPPSRIVEIDRDETKILSAQIVNPQMIVASVAFNPGATSELIFQQINFMQIRQMGS